MTIHIQLIGDENNREKAFDTLLENDNDFCPIDENEYFIYNENVLRLLRAEKISFKILGRE